MSYDRNRSDSPPLRIEPEFNGYQLIGDSQFLRFSEQLLKLKRKQNNGLAYLGLCVSGQKVGDLLRRVKDNFASVSEKVVLLIGTNDLLRGTSFEAMRDDLQSLLKQLRSKGAERIILLTLPPVPRLNGNGDHWNRLSKYNEFIQQCHNGKNTIVADAYAKFVIPKKKELSPPPPLRPPRRSAPCTSIFANGCGTAESPAICNLKEGTIRVSIGDQACRQVYFSGDSRDEEEDDRPALQRRLPTRSPLLQQGAALFTRHDSSDSRDAARKRRPRSPDEDSDDECRSPSAKRRFSPPNSGSSRIRSRSSTSSIGSRSSFGSDSYSKANDDHDDGYGRGSSRTEDQVALKNADEIRFEYFEKYFSGGRRDDLIHFNFNGLCLIRRLIMDIDDYF